MSQHYTKDTVLALLALIIIIQMVTLFFVINGELVKPSDQEVTFIWNDDEESIPVDGSLITLECTKGNIIYIGPYVPDTLARPTSDSLMRDYLNRSHVD